MSRINHGGSRRIAGQADPARDALQEWFRRERELREKRLAHAAKALGASAQLASVRKAAAMQSQRTAMRQTQLDPLKRLVDSTRAKEGLALEYFDEHSLEKG